MSRSADKSTEVQLRAIIDTANDAFVGIDGASVIVDWNPQAERVFGWCAKEAIGHMMPELIMPARFRDQHRRGLAHFLATGEGPVLFQTIELAGLRRDGTEFPIELTIWPTAVGDAVMFNAFVRDISERKRTRDFLSILQGVTAAANEAASSRPAFQRCLDLVCGQTGWPVGHVYVWSGDVLVPTDVWHLADPERFETFRRVTEATPLERGAGLPGRVLAAGEPVWIRDVRVDTNFPRNRLAEEMGVRAGFGFPVLAGTEVVAVLEFFAPEAAEPDEELLELMRYVGAQLGLVVERERAARASDEAMRALQSADELKSMFLQAVSHDLRVPLSAVLHASDLLQMDESVGDRQRELFSIIDRQAHRIDRMLSSLLDLERLEMGRVEPRPQPVALRPLLQEAVHNLGLETRVEAEIDDATLFADPTHVERILENLLGNALKYAPADGPIWVRVRAGDGGVLVTVEDTGPGVADAMKDRVFEMFVRGQDAGQGGLGVGLSLVRRFAEVNGGRAWVEDRPGGGASFRVRLPAAG